MAPSPILQLGHGIEQFEYVPLQTPDRTASTSAKASTLAFKSV